MDATAGEDDDSTLGLLLEDMNAPQPYEELVREELNHAMETMLQSLNPRQQQILRLRFGMQDGVCYSLEQVGKHLGVTKERVRQIEHQAMDKLRKLSGEIGLEDFLK